MFVGNNWPDQVMSVDMCIKLHFIRQFWRTVNNINYKRFILFIIHFFINWNYLKDRIYYLFTFPIVNYIEGFRNVLRSLHESSELKAIKSVWQTQLTTHCRRDWQCEYISTLTKNIYHLFSHYKTATLMLTPNINSFCAEKYLLIYYMRNYWYYIFIFFN